MPVRAMANSTGKNSIMVGARMVPSPNPEKNVRIAARNATNEIIRISIQAIDVLK